MVCLRCQRPGDPAVGLCARCGDALVQPTAPQLQAVVDALVAERLRGLLDRFAAEGAVTPELAQRLLAGLASADGAVGAPAAGGDVALRPAMAPVADALREVVAAGSAAPLLVEAALAGPMAPAIVKAVVAEATAAVVLEPAVAMAPGAGLADDDDHDHDDDPAEGMAGDLEALALLDAEKPRPRQPRPHLFQPPPSSGPSAGRAAPATRAPAEPAAPTWWETEGRGLLYENIGWLIGALLVIAGSIYGVREAWRSLGGVLRHAVVAGALFAYHAGFAGLAALVARRSQPAARVLGLVSLGLLPVVFIALASLTGITRAAGIALTLPFAALSFLTLRSVGRRLGLPRQLPELHLPLLLALLPLAFLAGDNPLRPALPLLGMGLCFWQLTRPRADAGELLLAGTGLYSLLVLCVYALVGTPGWGTTLGRSVTQLLSTGASAWVAGTVVLLVRLARLPELQKRRPSLSAVVEVLALATGVGTILAAFGMAADRPAAAARLYCLIAAGAVTVAFALAEQARPRALHLLVLCSLTTVHLATTVLLPDGPREWARACLCTVPAALLLLGSRQPAGRRRMALLGWAMVLGPILLIMVQEAERSRTGPLAATAVSGLLLTAAAHLGGRSLRWLHYLGGMAALAAGLSVYRDSGRATEPLVVLGALALIWGVIGARIDRPDAAASEEGLTPFDDLSLFALAGGLWLALARQPATTGPFLLEPGGLSAALARLGHQGLGLVLALGLLARSARDASRAVSTLGMLGLAALLLGATATRDSSQMALVLSALALLLALAASPLLPPDHVPAAGSPRRGRLLFGVIPLPGPAAGTLLVRDGMAFASLLLAAGGTLASISWIANFADAQRPLAIAAGALLMAVALVGFATPAFGSVGRRGSVVALTLVGLAIGLIATANRVGRPLPPGDYALRLTLIIAGVWLLGQLLERAGARLAAALGNPDEGPRYPWVAYAGVALLVLLILRSGLLVPGEPTRHLMLAPPLAFVGAALGLLLLGRSARTPWGSHLALPLLPLAVMLACAQQSLLGPALGMDVIHQRWVPIWALDLAGTLGTTDPATYLPRGVAATTVWARAFLGLAASSLGLAALAALFTRAHQSAGRTLAGLLCQRPDGGTVAELRGGAVRAAVGWAAVALSAMASLPDTTAAVLVVAASATLLSAGVPRAGLSLLTFAFLGALHGLAQAAATVPTSTGPGFAAVGLGIVLLAQRFRLPLMRVVTDDARPPDDPGRVRLSLEPAQLRPFASALLLCAVSLGLIYALAAGRRTTAFVAPLQLVVDAATALGGRFLATPSVAATLLLGAAAFLVLAFPAAAEPRPVTDHPPLARAAITAVLFAGGGAALGVLWLAHGGIDAALWQQALDGGRGAPPVASLLLYAAGPLVTAGLALVAAAAHALAFAVERGGLTGSAAGARRGRDVLIGITFALLGAYVRLLESPGVPVAPTGRVLIGLVPLLLLGGVCIHEVVTRRTPRHVYFVQLAAVGLYGIARVALRPRAAAEVDAVAALVLGFVLVGVTVQARRAGITAVADATRRFAALLPLLVALLLPRELSFRSAGFAVGSGLLYGTLGFVERSRLLGSLGAIATNLALLLFALASGLRGVEFYLGPLGLLVLVLGELFGPSMERPARQSVRLVGSLLLYAPAAVQMTLRLGQAESGLYSVVFGAACLIGIAAGMLMHIRAFLALGTGFFLLDLIANLVHVGLRDHRLGFVILSASGLLILGTMVMITLRREQLRAALQRLQRFIRHWD